MGEVPVKNGKKEKVMNLKDDKEEKVMNGKEGTIVLLMRNKT